MAEKNISSVSIYIYFLEYSVLCNHTLQKLSLK